MSFVELCNQVFNQAIRDYHVTDNIDTPINNLYERDSIEQIVSQVLDRHRAVAFSRGHHPRPTHRPYRSACSKEYRPQQPGSY